MFGSHISNNFHDDIILIHKAGGTLIQCFITDPIKHKTIKLTNDDIQNIKQHLHNNKIKMIIHAPYILNFARDFKENVWWVRVLLRELEYASLIGAKGSVIHFGKYLHLDKEDAIDNMIKSLKYIISNMPNDVYIYLETSCGQGSELGYKLEEFATIYNQFSNLEKERIKICIDTCHIFVSGYDIRNPEGFDSFIQKFDKLIGIKYIKLIHLNDSLKQLDSHVDRHQIIGEGYIGLKGLKYVYNWAIKKGLDIILETGGSFKEQKEKLIYE